jgi:hypothetical protein
VTGWVGGGCVLLRYNAFPLHLFFNLVTAPNAAKSIVSATISVVAIGR